MNVGNPSVRARVLLLRDAKIDAKRRSRNFREHHPELDLPLPPGFPLTIKARVGVVPRRKLTIGEPKIGQVSFDTQNDPTPLKEAGVTIIRGNTLVGELVCVGNIHDSAIMFAEKNANAIVLAEKIAPASSPKLYGRALCLASQYSSEAHSQFSPPRPLKVCESICHPKDNQPRGVKKGPFVEWSDVCMGKGLLSIVAASRPGVTRMLS
jgi:hypothetical protein